MKKNAMKLKELSDLEERKTAITEAEKEEAEAAGVARPLPCSSRQEGPSTALPRGRHPDTLLLGSLRASCVLRTCPHPRGPREVHRGFEVLCMLDPCLLPRTREATRGSPRPLPAHERRAGAGGPKAEEGRGRQGCSRSSGLLPGSPRSPRGSPFPRTVTPASLGPQATGPFCFSTCEQVSDSRPQEGTRGPV